MRAMNEWQRETEVVCGMSKIQWEKVKLKEICNFVNGDAYKDTDWSSKGIPIVRIQNLNNINKPFNYWKGSLEGKVTIDNNDLLLAWSGTPGTSFGAHIWDRGFAILNQHIFKVNYDEERSNIIWLKFAINQILDVMIEKSHGAVGLRHVTKSVVENLEIHLPPLEEQKRIVGIIEHKLKNIEKVKCLVSEQTILINELAELYTNDNFEKRKFPTDWEWKCLGDICTEDKVIVNGKVSNLQFVGLEMIKSNSGEIDLNAQTMPGLSTCYYFDERHILYGKLRPYLNKVALPNFKGRCSTELIPLFPKKGMSKEYIALLLKQKRTVNYVMTEKTGSRMPRANIKHLLSMKVHVPPLSEQIKIINLLKEKSKKVKILCHLLNEQKYMINLFPSSILRQAFQGKL